MSELPSVESLWNDYQADVIGSLGPIIPDGFIEMWRMAFYAGVTAIYEAALDPARGVPTSELEAWIKQIRVEIIHYTLELQHRPGIPS